MRSSIIPISLVLCILVALLPWTSTTPLHSGRRKNAVHRGANKALMSQQKGGQSPSYSDHPNSIQKDNTKTSTKIQRKNNTKGGYNCPMDSNSVGNGLAIIHADPFDCSKYYYCVWGVEQISECPSFLLWNDKDKVCDWFWNVTCNL